MSRRLLPLAALLLAGCAMGPNYKRPGAQPPAAFRGQAQAEAASLADQPWWDVFGDPTLKDLVAEALKSNFDARTATWRVEEYRARLGIERSGWFPAIVPGASWNRGRQSTYSASGHDLGQGYDLHAGASWELDLWGRVRRLNEAALAGYLGAQDARRGVYLATLATTASAY
ncbi:MAG: TolC family protein, partial [Holophaga sp.]|nr:TolC family protein [Holophaga sp.]